MAYFISSGVVSTGISLYNNSMYISSGGIANNTTVNYSSLIGVSSGGVVNSTVVNSIGAVGILSGGVANYTTVNHSGAILIFSGGKANNTKVNYGGDMDISSGGVASNTTVNSNGLTFVHSGGVANNTKVNNGGIMVIDSGVANSTTVNYGGLILISSGGVANNTTVNSGGFMRIDSGSVHRGSWQIENTATVSAFSGATVDFTLSDRNESDGYLINNLALISGTPTYTITISANQAFGTYKLAQGAENFTGSISIGTNDSVLGAITVNGDVLMYNNVNYTLTQSNGNLLLDIHTAKAPTVFIYSGDTLTSSGVEITGAILASSGNNIMHISSGGVANSTTINYDGEMSISSGGVANNTTVNTSGYMYTLSGGVANSTTVNFDGVIGVFNGGMANNTTLNSSGYLIILSDGVANSTTVNYGGIMAIDTFGMANNTAVNGFLLISSGGVANSTTVINSDGRMSIDAGGIADNTVNNGFLFISSGGMANNTINNAYLIVSSGGVHHGSLQIANGAVVSAYSGSIIDFTVAGRTAEDGYLINNLALISGAPTYGITVSADQAFGTYKLAQGAENFTGSISVGSNDSVLGTITVNGGALKHNNVNYTLTQSNGNLLLNVRTAETPAVFIYSGDTLTSSGAEVTGALLVSGGNNLMHISSGGVANSTTVNTSGIMLIYSGGVANSTMVNSDGGMGVGGVANNTEINSDGLAVVFSDGFANSTTVNSSGFMYISSGGLANNNKVNSYGFMNIFSGGLACNTMVNSGGFMGIDSSGIHFGSLQIANGAVVSAYSGSIIDFTVAGRTAEDGYLINNLALISGAPTYGITVSADQAFGTYKLAQGAENFTGSISVGSNDSVLGTITVNGGALKHNNVNYTLTQSNGNLLLNVRTAETPAVVIYSGDTLTSSGEEVTGAILTSGEAMHISNGGVANSTTVNSGGIMFISSGGTHRGSLQIENGATVSAYTGATVDFTLSDRKESDGYLINNLSLISGAPTYTITVSENQANGIYKLAQGAGNFSGSISVGNGSVNYGTLTANSGNVKYSNTSYSLVLSNGNLSLSVVNNAVESTLTGNKNGVSFTNISGDAKVEFSKDNFASVLAVEVDTNAVDTYGMLEGTYQWQVCAGGICYRGDNIVSEDEVAQMAFFSDNDGNTDIFFANADGIWEKSYIAEHHGNDSWKGTKELVFLEGKNKIGCVFNGSHDANVLVLTDSLNGDALFIDDIYTHFGNNAARLAQINEIRAGAGNDVIDLTSQRFAFKGDGATIYGGDGNDTIWANRGNNTLFGDAGNDRLVASYGNDVIIGGAGNDSMHGGGGRDTFCFGANWGNDTVEQLAGGSVILHFETGSSDNWNAETLTYTDGSNSVKVTGVESVKLVFGGTAPVEGAFLDAASEKIFEDKNKGMIA